LDLRFFSFQNYCFFKRNCTWPDICFAYIKSCSLFPRYAVFKVHRGFRPLSRALSRSGASNILLLSLPHVNSFFLFFWVFFHVFFCVPAVECRRPGCCKTMGKCGMCAKKWKV